MDRPVHPSMGDSETVVAETSAAVTYASTTYNSDGYANTVPNPVPEAGPTAAETAGEAAQANSTYGFDYFNVGDGNAHSEDPNSVLQQAQFKTTDSSKQALGVADTNETASGLGNTATESTQVSDYNSSGNGGVVVASANETRLENGNALENIDGSAEEKQVADGYAAMSAEED